MIEKIMVKEAENFDVIIIGGGIAGLLQTILLAQNNIPTLCLDKQSTADLKNSPLSKRTTAISYGSAQIFKRADLWNDLLPHACPIQDIQIKDGRSPTLLNFEIAEDEAAYQEGAFGWVIENYYIRDVLIAKIKTLPHAVYIEGCAVENIQTASENIEISTRDNKEYSATLLIGADGRQSYVRQHCKIETEEHSYDQRAIVSIITHQNPHHNIAVENFKSSGPFAILPMMDNAQGAHRSSIVWTEEANTKNSIMNFKDKTFLAALNAQFPEEYGDILSASERFAYPLGYVHAHSYIAPRISLIGDAAHGIHPIAGQGLNLGLRDIAALSDLIIQTHNDKQDIGSKNLLEQYQLNRRGDNHFMSFATSGINSIFSNNKKSMRQLRKIGLKLIGRIKPARKIILTHAMGTNKK